MIQSVNHAAEAMIGIHAGPDRSVRGVVESEEWFVGMDQEDLIELIDEILNIKRAEALGRPYP